MFEYLEMNLKEMHSKFLVQRLLELLGQKIESIIDRVTLKSY